MRDLFNNITPSFGPFQAIFGHWFGIILAFVWAAGIAYAVFHLAIAIASIARARRQHRHDAEDILGKVLWPALALVFLFLLPVFYLALYDSAQQVPEITPAPSATAEPS